MARRTIRVSDLSGELIEPGQGVKIRVTYEDARRPSREVDVTIEEAESLLGGRGRIVARRGRPAGTQIKRGKRKAKSFEMDVASVSEEMVDETVPA